MSVYLHRLVETREKDGKWHLSTWYTDFKKVFENDTPDIGSDTQFPLKRHNITYSNAELYRVLLDNNCFLTGRDIPTDMSEEGKTIIDSYGEWASDHAYITLSEINECVENMRAKLFSNIEKEYCKTYLSNISDKLDCLLTHREYIMPDKEDKRTTDKLSYYLTDGVDEFMDIASERDFIKFIAMNVKGSIWIDENNIRCIYFFA